MNIAAFSLVDLEQGTPAWLDWRRGGIGASDAPTIMGENPWKSARALANDKLNRRGNGWTNAAMSEGNRLEPIARAAYAIASGVMAEPACLQSSTHGWMRASVDGLCLKTKRAVEIKCGKASYEKTAQSRKVPKYYVGQLQHILAVTGYDAIDFCVYYPGCEMIHFPVARDNDYIARLQLAEEKFWRVIENAANGYKNTADLFD
jgi:putative phage-type endonuclease